MTLGAIIARGSRSVVHEWGADAVAKVPLAGTPEGWIRFEANYAAAVHACGVPSPRVLGLESIHGRDISIFERIDGPTMWESLKSNPGSARQIGQQFGELHCDLLSVLGPIALPTQRTRLAAKLYASARSSPRSTARSSDGFTGTRTIGLINEIPENDSRSVLCHGDFHPMNIIISNRGPMIVDWFDAGRGSAIGDIARTSVLLSVVGNAHLPGATAALLDCLHTEYLRTVQISAGVSFDDLPRWIEIQRAARLSEGIDQELPLQLTAWQIRG